MGEVNIRVLMWGKQIGTLSVDSENKAYYIFKYDDDFIKSNIEVCPILMPLRQAPYRFEKLSVDSFKGLVPLVVDSLPDRYGNALLKAWIEDNNIKDVSPDEILLFIGKRGMGALEYEPSMDDVNKAQDIEIDLLLKAAQQILTQRKSYRDNINENDYLKRLIDVGTSVGGARAKAVIAINKKGDIKSGQIAGLKGYKYYILKFDGINSDIYDDDNNANPFTKLEYVYYQIAKDSGINMQPSNLLNVNGKSHFLTERFDRDENGEKIHMLSLAGMAGFDYKHPGENSYEEVALLLRRIHCANDDIKQLFRRMVFNVIGKNHDDHVKNIAFLMDKKGNWRLSPAYDLTYSYNPDGAWTKHHQMTINNKVDDIKYEDIMMSAKIFGIGKKEANDIVQEISNAFNNFAKYAKTVNIPEDIIKDRKNHFVKLI